MNLFSHHFLVFFGILFLAYRQLRSVTGRRVILTIANLVFLLTFLQTIKDWLALAVFLLLSYVMLILIRDSWKWICGLFIALILAALVFFRRYEFLGWFVPSAALHHTLALTGISYMTFKAIHLIVDQRQGQLAPFTFLSYLNYQIGFFSLVAGPIQRYNDFFQFWQDPGKTPDTERDGLESWNRMLTGMLKLGLLGTAAFYLHNKARELIVPQAGAAQAVTALLSSFYAYPAFVYFNFSGYCDVVIGGAALLGMKQAENFDRPYLARNMIDFWNRWHISLTQWIRDYVFNASYKWVAERWSRLASKAGYVLLFTALFLAGLWHGSTWNFAIFGLIHGVGVMATQIYGDALRAVFGRAGVKKYMASSWARVAAVAVTLNYVCFSFLFFSPELDRTMDMLKLVYSKVF
ncbi:MAG: hypothetical protein HY235_29520 [Acidobacteria bacterium]|nr:hypothetical protein [Acidobacteriota bacterium]